ncbi:MAG: NADH:ubiquinone reductase (Na(+)-transporting) subunit B [Candidatus Marinimicrobia bacterium]|nr:NADH:ubiquinone reductase (Na(+)-transporting) subunit B [Candidatus Neomarinimicrobiota bacterium]MBL7022986.1 NADH:ubiquinone reductase (Na(+)-transporting) subunit B [Candidatus Neomarinimicrobiota bacterium]
MKFLRKFLDKIEPNFQEGGKLEKFSALFEMSDTLLYTSDKVTDNAPHIRDSIDLKRAMYMVVVALIPIAIFGMFNIGYQDDVTRSILANILAGAKVFLPILLVSYLSGGFWEVLFATVRKHEVNEGFFVTGLLIPLIVPPTIPLWMVAVATSFGVVIGKEIFGGTGYNIFNPALVTRAFLFFAYPGAISGDTVWVVDGVTKATPLATYATGSATSHTWLDMFYGFIPGSIGETSTLIILFSGLFLIITKIANWRIIFGILTGMVGFAYLTNLMASASSNPMLALTPQTHLVIGGFAFGMVFMATDPVSASQTNAGRWIYGIMIGALTVIIRSLNPAFPEGMMLAILLGNAFAPLIDYYVLRGHIKRRQKRYAQ